MSSIQNTIATLAVVVAARLVGSLTGCAEAFKSIDEVNNPEDDKALARCHVEARAEQQITGDPEAAGRAYLACTRDAGLR
jgi:hypothetical protein